MPQGLGQLLVVVLFVVIGYVLLIRPTRKRAREVDALQRALSVGDEVMLTSGIFGRLTSVGEERLDVEIAPGTVISVHRGAVGRIVADSARAPADRAPEDDETEHLDVSGPDPSHPEQGAS